jgi:hypothetical protein
MQAADAILWWDGMKKTPTNYVVTSYLIPTILSAQVMFLPAVTLKNEYPLYTISAAVASAFMFYRLNGYSRPVENKPLSSPEWGSPPLGAGEALFFALLVFGYSFRRFLMAAGTILSINYLVGGAIGSLWCAVANVASVYYLLTY